jgi:hypothetical protein
MSCVLGWADPLVVARTAYHMALAPYLCNSICGIASRPQCAVAPHTRTHTQAAWSHHTCRRALSSTRIWGCERKSHHTQAPRPVPSQWTTHCARLVSPLENFFWSLRNSTARALDRKGQWLLPTQYRGSGLAPPHHKQPAGDCLASGDSDNETDEFTLDAAAVVAEEAVERKEARRVKPWLSELDVCTGVAGAGGGPAGAEEDVEEHQDTNIACVAGTGQKMDRAQDATLTNRGPR